MNLKFLDLKTIFYFIFYFFVHYAQIDFYIPAYIKKGRETAMHALWHT